MVDTIIVSGGNIQKDFALDFLRKSINRKTGAPFLIAADKGLEFFIEAGIRPDAAVGDFDSLSEEGKKYLEYTKDLEVLRLKPEKDDSDTQSAVNFSAAKGAKEIVLLGSTGSRMDHMLANLGLLALGKEKGIRIVVIDAHNYITLVENGTVLRREEQFGEYVSFFPVGGDVKGLTLEGFKYPLQGHRLVFSDSGLTVSNEIAEETAKITFTEGMLLMIMSRD